MLNWPVLSASFEESPHHLQFLTSLEGFTGGRRIKGKKKTVEAIAYHAVIHLLMGALGFIPLPNKGRQDNLYLYVGQDWKYSKLSVQIHATAKNVWLFYKCHHYSGQCGLQD